MKNLLFIGGAGFIGSSIINQIDYTDCNIYLLDSKSANKSRIKNSKVKFIIGNIADTEQIENLIISKGITKIIHLVSSLIPGSNFDEYIREYENVIVPTIKLIKISSKHNVQFVFFSSGGTIYGNRDSLESNKENEPKEPISYYGLSKQTIENSILFENRVSGLKYLILRPSNPYGPGQNIHGNQGIIAVSLGKIFSNEPINIWGDGTSIRDYIYIEDLAKAVVQLLKYDISNATINIGSGHGYSINHIISVINEIVSNRLKVNYVNNRSVDVSNMILDVSLLKSLVDIDYTPLEDGIRQFYRYELQQKSK